MTQMWFLVSGHTSLVPFGHVQARFCNPFEPKNALKENDF